MRILRNSARILGGVFILSLTLSAQTFTTLYNFESQSHDGICPLSGVILGPRGVLYGTTSSGGRWNDGTVYELLPPASPGGAWTEVVLHSFNGQDGYGPSAGLVVGRNGSLYGVTQTLGRSNIAFRLDPPTGTSAHWPFTVLSQFTSDNIGPPSGALVFGAGGSLYGGTGGQGLSGGTVYSLTPPSVAGGAWTEAALYSFPGGSGGFGIAGPLAVGSGGGLFGVTTYGGQDSGSCIVGPGGCGTVFLLAPPTASSGAWTVRLLYDFWTSIIVGTDGIHPQAGVLLAPAGVLYGITASGGSAGEGTVYSLTPPAVPGGPATERILHSFPYTDYDGFTPVGLVLGASGVLYGTTQSGGAYGFGTVFQVAPGGLGGFTETILYSFKSDDQGFGPLPNGITLGPDGTLYGTTQQGGTLSHGSVFALTP